MLAIHSVLTLSGQMLYACNILLYDICASWPISFYQQLENISRYSEASEVLENFEEIFLGTTWTIFHYIPLCHPTLTG